MLTLRPSEEIVLGDRLELQARAVSVCTDDVEPIASNVFCADGKSDNSGVVACEEVLAPGLETRPLLPLRQLHEPRRLQPPLRLVA